MCNNSLISIMNLVAKWSYGKSIKLTDHQANSRFPIIYKVSPTTKNASFAVGFTPNTP